MTDNWRDEQLVRDKFRDRFKCSNADYDAILRMWGGASRAGRPLAFKKAMRAAGGSRGDGTLIAIAEAFLYGRRSRDED